MNIVHELRIKKGIQQKELALELGVSNAAVSNWEKGKSDPSGKRLKKLSEIFEVDPLVTSCLYFRKRKARHRGR